MPQTETRSSSIRRQGRYWLLTIKRHLWVPQLPDGCSYVKGQAEIGEDTGFEHWQVIAITKKKASLAAVKRIFGIESIHGELTYSSAANEYVWKEATRIEETQFEFGEIPFKRNDPADYERVWELAVSGRLMEIPADIRVRSYHTLRSITADFAEPTAMEREVVVYWGPTGTGKSRRAWSEAGLDAYPKDPRSKFWCGYRGQDRVVIDEFRGDIAISHILRWLDRYPVIVEIKGSSVVLKATKIWITSNLHPERWYNDIDQTTYFALLRRINIIHIA